jgi:hypothetical protein
LGKCGNTSDKAWQLEENKGNTKKTFSRNSEKEHEKNRKKQEININKKTEQEKNRKKARNNSNPKSWPLASIKYDNVRTNDAKNIGEIFQ